MSKIFDRLRLELRKKDNLLIAVAVLAALTVMLAVTAALMLKPAEYDQPTVSVLGTEVENDQLLRHPLTGERLTAELPRTPQVYGVMVENSADAWPLSGVEEAFLVIEAPVEGNIPRFLAFFSGEHDELNVAARNVDQIGPVRSARPYYLDWAAEFDALYAHVGGSPEALELIAKRDLLDLNQFYHGWDFWRDEIYRYAPHNVYTSTDQLWDATAELKASLPTFDSWLFKDDAPLDTDPLSVVMNWGDGDVYDIIWVYDADNNAYTRKQNSGIVKSADGDQVIANNVVVMASDITVVDSVGRRHIRTLGTGDALIVQDGKITLGTWNKPSVDERLRFYDAAGQEVRMNAGKTWIEVVPSLDRASTIASLQ